MKNIIGKRIVMARKDAEINQEILAQKMGVSRHTIVLWENEKYSPSREHLQELSKIFDKPISYFQEIKEPFENVDSAGVRPYIDKNMMNLPLLASIPAGFPAYSDRDVEMYVDIPRYLFPGADFMIRCSGHSMEPMIPEGAFCVVKKEVNPLNNKIMIVKTCEGFTIKKLVKIGKGYELHPLNNDHKVIKPKELIVVGEVIGICNKF